jgi:lactate oxidase
MDATRRKIVLSGAAALASTAAFGQSPLPPAPIPSQTGEEMARPDIAYQGSTANQPLRIVNLLQLEPDAQKILPPGGFDYISGGSGANWTRGENLAAFSRVQIEPYPLAGVTKVDLSTSLLGSTFSMPIFIPPMGSHGLAHVSKEEASARAAFATKALMATSTQSNLSMEEIAAFNPGPKWFQIYVPSDRGYLRELIQRAKAAGYTAVAPTIDNSYAYPREENIRNAFRPPSSLGKGNMPRTITDPAAAVAAFEGRKRDLNWNDLEFIKKEFGGPVIVKGVMSPKIAADACTRGMDAVYVSNHGGRAFDGVEGTFSVLPRITEAVRGRVPIVLDGGIRRGTDVFKALALGATMVGCGRPILYGMALGGAAGAQSVLEYLRDNLTLTMRLAGAASVKEISRDYIAPSGRG